jgi:methionine synthase I (cobalamin-dependent)
MTREEAKSLEGDIANDVLNNFPLSGLVVLATEAAKARAKQMMDEGTDEALVEMAGKYAEVKARVEAERQAKAESETPPSLPEDSSSVTTE